MFQPPRAFAASLALVLAVALAAMGVLPSPARAAGPRLPDRAPSPTRDGHAKGTGSASEPERTGRFIVRYAAGVTKADRARVRAAEHLDHAADLPLPNAEVVVSAAGSVARLTTLRARPEVRSVDPEYRRHTFANPAAEPLFDREWGLHNTGQTINGFKGVPDVDMNVRQAWSITKGSPDVLVAVVDSGVDIDHPDLAARIWTNPGEIAGNGLDDDDNGFIDDVHGWDFCEDDNSVFADGDDHGTHVAGTIAASANGVGIAGIAPRVTILPVRFLSDVDPTCGTDAQAIAAVEYAIANGVDVINASWGGTGVSAALEDAFALSAKPIVVAAAGNSDSNNDVSPVYPASYDLPNILSVAAVHNEGFLSDFSNYGPTSVDVAAPGEDILSSLPDESWGYGSGTSMAAANASGVAALVASADPDLRHHGPALRRHLIATARALPLTLGWIANARLLDARAAVVSRPDITRLAGSDRYATAAAISKATFTPGVPYAFVANGLTFPDALAGGAVAAQLDVPLLLVSPTSIPSATKSELKRLKPFVIVVLGGTGVVSAGVEAALDAYDDPSSGGPIRLAGADRYATAAAISNAAFDPGVPTAFIATGLNFPDALAGVPASAARGGPLLLVNRTSIPTATARELNRLNPDQIVILGASGVVSGSVATKLHQYTTGSVSRWAGDDRFETAATVAQRAFPKSETAFVANGLLFPDALAGGPAGGAYLGPLLLVSATSSPAVTNQQLRRLDPARIFVLGGTGVVSNGVVSKLRSLFD